MPGPHPQPLGLKRKQRVLLKQLSCRRQSPHQLVYRSQIILLAERGVNHSDIARQVNCHRSTVGRWCERWRANQQRLRAAQARGASEALLRKMIVEILSDEPRTGTPAGFSVEQVVQVIALACEDPEKSGRPVTHWTPQELASEIVKRG